MKTSLGIRRCDKPGCKSFHYSSGLCRKHYYKQYEQGKKRKRDEATTHH